jgi:hypothetical protein
VTKVTGHDIPLACASLLTVAEEISHGGLYKSKILEHQKLWPPSSVESCIGTPAWSSARPKVTVATDVCILGTEMRERYCPQRAEGERTGLGLHSRQTTRPPLAGGRCGWALRILKRREGGDLPPPEGGGSPNLLSPTRFVRVEPRGSSRVEHIN